MKPVDALPLADVEFTYDALAEELLLFRLTCMEALALEEGTRTYAMNLVQALEMSAQLHQAISPMHRSTLSRGVKPPSAGAGNGSVSAELGSLNR